MQTVSQATELVSYATGTHRGRAYQIARALIDAAILPKSSGRDIKKISAAQLLPLLAAVAMADKVADAPNIARAFSDLPFEGKVDKHVNFATMFQQIIDERDVWKRAEVEFAKVDTGYTANIRGIIAKSHDEDVEVLFPFWNEKSWGGFSKRSFTISAEGIEVLRNLFARDDIEGMKFSLMG